ncbi:4'-phosphopantetheinyl transferase family protein [Shewanella donghaensis]|uniref:4'-phosphopantetheinyl transferase family protein n=1 Tax=Shewanella donghaensis TaxID=238836 RepID=UPI0029CA79AF|nr:4'-phosphopantetheinyl transferase superfamily protein [Shewanella donghaensis]
MKKATIAFYLLVEFNLKPAASVNLFFCPLKTGLLDEETASLVTSWLPEDETLKVNRYIQLSAREQGLMVRGYLRVLLSRFADIKPNEWAFEYGEKGKPRLSEQHFNQTGLRFNLSHSGDWLFVAIHQHDNATESTHQYEQIQLGADIERRRESTNIHSILSHYFSKPEEAALLALPEAEHRERFFDLWTLKESYIKAKGLGLSLSLKSFSFDFNAVELHTLKVLKGDVLQLQSKVSLSLLNDDIKRFEFDSQWHCCLGQLDEAYRFAISFQAGSDQTPDYIAEEIDWAELIKAVKPHS